MEDNFLSDSLLIYVEKDIAEKFCIKSIINGFYDFKKYGISLY